MDDIFIIYTDCETNLNNLINVINRFHINRRFSLTLEIGWQIQFFQVTQYVNTTKDRHFSKTNYDRNDNIL